MFYIILIASFIIGIITKCKNVQAVAATLLISAVVLIISDKYYSNKLDRIRIKANRKLDKKLSRLQKRCKSAFTFTNKSYDIKRKMEKKIEKKIKRNDLKCNIIQMIFVLFPVITLVLALYGKL